MIIYTLMAYETLLLQKIVLYWAKYSALCSGIILDGTQGTMQVAGVWTWVICVPGKCLLTVSYFSDSGIRCIEPGLGHGPWAPSRQLGGRERFWEITSAGSGVTPGSSLWNLASTVDYMGCRYLKHCLSWIGCVQGKHPISLAQRNIFYLDF